MIQANYYPPNGYPYQTCADFRGESTDTKPSDVSEGSTFHEWDTGNEYMFDGSDWLLQSGGGGGGGGAEVYPLTYYDPNGIYTLNGVIQCGTEVTPGGGGESAYITEGTEVYAAKKGDTFYACYYGTLTEGQYFNVVFTDNEGNFIPLSEVRSGDFTEDSGSTYFEYTVPDKDANGDDYGGTGFIYIQIDSD